MVKSQVVPSLRTGSGSRLTAGREMDVIAAELGGHRELLPHRPLLAFTVQRHGRRMMLHLRIATITSHLLLLTLLGQTWSHGHGLSLIHI